MYPVERDYSMPVADKEQRVWVEKDKVKDGLSCSFGYKMHRSERTKEEDVFSNMCIGQCGMGEAWELIQTL